MMGMKLSSSKIPCESYAQIKKDILHIPPLTLAENGAPISNIPFTSW